MPILKLISGKSEGIPPRPITIVSVASDVVSWPEEIWVPRKNEFWVGDRRKMFCRKSTMSLLNVMPMVSLSMGNLSQLNLNSHSWTYNRHPGKAEINKKDVLSSPFVPCVFSPCPR